MTKVSSLVALLGAGVDQTNDLFEIIDMSETGAARNKKITVAQLLGLVTDIAGLLDFKGSTDCSANPNYPVASKGDYYLVSVAGKIGGASGIVVTAGDTFFAIVDNAGGTQAGVGSSWTVIEGNVGYAPVNKAGDTMTGDLIVPDEAYDATAWNGSLEVPTKNAVRDKIEAVVAGAAAVSDAVYGAGWDGDTINAPSKNAVYDKIETIAGTSGRLLGRQIITATGAGTYTPTAGTNSIIIEMVGGGGGGGGVASPGASNNAFANGGGGGAYLRKRLTSAFSGAGYVVGAKGTGGSAGTNAGNAGSDTTFTATGGGGTVYTAGGGAGGSGGGASTTVPRIGAATAGGVATNGDINVDGGNASYAISASINNALGGPGGTSIYSPGAIQPRHNAAAATAAGSNATGKGGGGSGAVATTTGAAAAGGNGSDGLIIIWEYS